LELGADEVDLQDSISRFCQQQLGADVRSRAASRFTRPLWRELAQTGLLEIAGAREPTSILHACLGLEILGYYGFPGPIPHTVALSRSLNREDWSAVSSGETLMTFGTGDLFAWGAVADTITGCEGGRLVRMQCSGKQPADTLGRTEAAVIARSGTRDLGDGTLPLAIFDTGVAAYCAGAGRFLVTSAAEHARLRKQFGKPIGEFQAVAFPLAQALMKLDAAQILARLAALAIGRESAQGPDLAAAARISATRAALAAAFAAHQTYGAFGVLDDGPVGWLSRRIQEYATLEPSVRRCRSELSLGVIDALDADIVGRAGTA
jgi:alkylation response protein AidB-like acyl-CoA dehydrogenase